MTVSENTWFEVEVYYKPSMIKGSKEEYIGTAEDFEEADELVIEDCAKYLEGEDYRNPSNYKYVKNCEDPRDIEDQDESWSDVTDLDVQEFVSNGEPPMTDGEFHRWANPSL